MQLFRDNTIKTVFYIRKVDSTEAPTDLEIAILMLFLLSMKNGSE